MKLKDEIRSKIKIKRKTLASEEKYKFDGLIYEKIISTVSYQKANKIFIFVSFGDEVDTHQTIYKAFQDNKQVYVPKVISKKEGMVAVKIQSFQDLKPGIMGILEPENVEIHEDNYEFDLAIIPGLAFDKAGGRIGYGGGYYDRFLNNVAKNCRLICIGYEFQLIENIPMEAHDIRVHGIITENNFYDFKEDEK